ncbi:hypothetical protein DFP72DRAFT_1138877 [Ephemerocybe angulata]|uniref:Uncharacterized protein n=1 Tax=Ephemerocybe angulata TaxID=980116 RepID=A0A8H6M3J4_9AGAR|nr:hypothetical protein DFP72DRAFT_1138877 [Tulosesus angulatus]
MQAWIIREHMCGHGPVQVKRSCQIALASTVSSASSAQDNSRLHNLRNPRNAFGSNDAPSHRVQGPLSLAQEPTCRTKIEWKRKDLKRAMSKVDRKMKETYAWGAKEAEAGSLNSRGSVGRLFCSAPLAAACRHGSGAGAVDVLRAIGATGAAPNEVEGLLCLSHRAMVVMRMPRVDEVVGAPAANQRMVVAISLWSEMDEEGPLVALEGAEEGASVAVVESAIPFPKEKRLFSETEIKGGLGHGRRETVMLSEWDQEESGEVLSPHIR